MNKWESSLFNEKMGNKIKFGIIIGMSLSGKTEIASFLNK
jgi:hypothetical protein